MLAVFFSVSEVGNKLSNLSRNIVVASWFSHFYTGWPGLGDARKCKRKKILLNLLQWILHLDVFFFSGRWAMIFFVGVEEAHVSADLQVAFDLCHPAIINFNAPLS